MRKIKEVLRLRGKGLSNRKIARSCSVSRSTVAEYLERATKADISWPLSEGTDDAHLERLLFPDELPEHAPEVQIPDWRQVHCELKRKGVTLQLLWREYCAVHTGGYRYSQYCNIYRQWAKKLDISMRQVHKAGEKLFVDYAGQTVPITDRLTGEVSPAQIFVSVLGASSYTYAEATWTQKLPDWIGSHIRAFEFYQGLVEILVPDNLRSAISKTCRYEPGINPTYQEMAMHYGIAVIPARVRKPKDKAKAEAGVLLVERWILASLRNRTFFGLGELNTAIRELLAWLNSREFRKMKGESRRSLYEKLDRPALKPLPAQRYDNAEWTRAGVNIDYHVDVDNHYYSVPYRLVGEKLDVRLTVSVIELFHNSNRVASHARSYVKWQPTTLKEHMPKAHQRYGEWPPSRIIGWAEKTGPLTAAVCAKIMESRPHPEQGYRSCLGLLRLDGKYGAERVEAACKRALAIDAPTYRSVESILKGGHDRQELLPAVEQTSPIEHPHIRGSEYYK